MPFEKLSHEIAEAGDGKRRQQSAKRTQGGDYETMSYHGSSGPAERTLLSSPFGMTARGHDSSIQDYEKTSIGSEGEKQERTNTGSSEDEAELNHPVVEMRHTDNPEVPQNRQEQILLLVSHMVAFPHKRKSKIIQHMCF